MRRIALGLFVFGLALVPRAAAGEEGPSVVDIVKVHGSIDRTVAGYLEDALDEAERAGHTVVIQLDTAGTLDQPALELANHIFEAEVPVITWVGPAPAKAQGAGLLFMYASSLAAVAPGVGIGPLEPLDLVDATAAEAPAPAALMETVVGWAEQRDKPVDISFPERQVPAQAALDANAAEIAAVSLPDLLNDKVDGLTVTTAAGPATLETRLPEDPTEPPVQWQFHDLGPVNKVMHAVASPSAIYVLLALGFACLAFELVQPGFGFAGFAGVGMLALAFYGLTVVPASWLGMACVVLGVILLSADVALRRLGVLTAAGLGAFVLGSVLAFRGVSPAVDLSPWLVGSFTVASLLYYGFVLTVAIQSRERITSTQQGLIGLVGETRGKLEPEGPVFVKGTLWRGRASDGPIPPGTRIRVRGLDGLVLRVEPDPDDG